MLEAVYEIPGKLSNLGENKYQFKIAPSGPPQKHKYINKHINAAFNCKHHHN